MITTTTRPARHSAGQTPPPILRPATGEALALTGRPYLSHSQLSTFRGCPRKFAFLYVEKTAPEFQPSSLLFGSAMHSAFEFHFRALLEGLTTSTGDLLHAFLQAWQEQRESATHVVPIKFNKNEDMASVTDLATRMIDAFLASSLARPHGQIVGVEEQFTVTLAPNLPDVLARVDLVTQTEDSLHVVDLKTSRSKWSDEKAAEGADQLRLYGRTVRKMAESIGLPVKLHFAILTKAKKPVVQILDVPVDEHRLSTVRESVAQVWTAVKAGNRGGYFANPTPMNCSTCPFKTQCPAFATTGKGQPVPADIPI